MEGLGSIGLWVYRAYRIGFRAQGLKGLGSRGSRVWTPNRFWVLKVWGFEYESIVRVQGLSSVYLEGHGDF